MRHKYGRYCSCQYYNTCRTLAVSQSQASVGSSPILDQVILRLRYASGSASTNVSIGACCANDEAIVDATTQDNQDTTVKLTS